MFTPKLIKAFNEVEMNMYNFVIDNKETIPYMTIREFSSEVKASTTSVLKFCKKLGYDGFLEFKVCFKQILENEKCTISYTDDKQGLFQDFLAKAETPMFGKKLNLAVEIISKQDKLFCIGVGPTGSIAYYAAAHLSISGFFAVYLDEYRMLNVSRAKGDTYLIFCVSGESRDAVEIIRKIKASGGRVVLVTNSNYSTLAKSADVVIDYNIYYAKSLQRTVPTLSGQDNMDYIVDSFSTQLPAIYIIEAISKKLSQRIKDNQPFNCIE